MKFQLFVDLDGVLADFEAGFRSRFGKSAATLEAEGGSIHEVIGGVPTFYEELRSLPGAYEFWDKLCMLHPDPVILTSAGETYFAQNARSKQRWVRRRLWSTRHDPIVVPVKSGRRKGAFAQRLQDVLIDDYAPNCEAWRKAGGTAIHHLGDFDMTLSKLVAVTLPWR